MVAGAVVKVAVAVGIELIRLEIKKSHLVFRVGFLFCPYRRINQSYQYPDNIARKNPLHRVV